MKCLTLSISNMMFLLEHFVTSVDANKMTERFKPPHTDSLDVFIMPAAVG